MQNKIKKPIKIILIAIFWLIIWELIAIFVGYELLVPSPIKVAERCVYLFGQGEFWAAILSTVLRVVAGFVFGVLFGVIMGWLTNKIKLLSRLFSPLLKIIRATPVASFIILVFVWLKSDTVPIFIAFLTVSPIIWQTVFDGLQNVDTDLQKMAKVYGLSEWKTLWHISAMSLLPEFLTACVNALGFAWKSGVAAEVIALPTVSIGKYLYRAKVVLETADVFACTLTVILLSVIFEYILKRLVKGRAAK